jgi:hypothetical protein
MLRKVGQIFVTVILVTLNMMVDKII